MVDEVQGVASTKELLKVVQPLNRTLLLLETSVSLATRCRVIFHCEVSFLLVASQIAMQLRPSNIRTCGACPKHCHLNCTGRRSCTHTLSKFVSFKSGCAQPVSAPTIQPYQLAVCCYTTHQSNPLQRHSIQAPVSCRQCSSLTSVSDI